MNCKTRLRTSRSGDAQNRYLDFLEVGLLGFVLFFPASAFFAAGLAGVFADVAGLVLPGFSADLSESVSGFEGLTDFAVGLTVVEAGFPDAEADGALAFAGEALELVAEADFLGTGFPVALGEGEAPSLIGCSGLAEGSLAWPIDASSLFTLASDFTGFDGFAEGALGLDLPDFFGSSLAFIFGGFSMAS
jgi:hypothetical protein